MDRQVVIDLERTFRNAARRHARAGGHESAAAYRHAAWLLRQALRETT